MQIFYSHFYWFFTWLWKQILPASIFRNICTHNSNNNDNNDSNNNDNNDNDDNDNNEFILEYSFYMKFALCPKIIYKKRNTIL